MHPIHVTHTHLTDDGSLAGSSLHAGESKHNSQCKHAYFDSHVHS